MTLSSCKSPKMEPLNLLVFSKTAGYRHESIPAGLKALNEIAGNKGWKITATEDSTLFTPSVLDTIDVVVFLSTSGDVFGEIQENALQQFVESGGGLATIHSGTDTEYNWDWYQNAIGAHFTGHPPVQKAKLIIEGHNHPATKHFQTKTWEAEDEWYSFHRNPRNDVHVLISIDESTYNVDDNRWFEGVKQRMGDHPLVWYKRVGKGIVFQSAPGHTNEMYDDPLYRQHLIGMIEFCSGNN